MYAVMYATANLPTGAATKAHGERRRGLRFTRRLDAGLVKDPRGQGARRPRWKEHAKKDACPCKDGRPPLVLSIEGGRPRSFHDREDDGRAQEHRQRPRHRSCRRARDRRPHRRRPAAGRSRSVVHQRCGAHVHRIGNARGGRRLDRGDHLRGGTDNRLSKLSRCRRQRGMRQPRLPGLPRCRRRLGVRQLRRPLRRGVGNLQQ